MVVIGLDAADPLLIEKWADDGDLPNLNLLRKRGEWVSLSHCGAVPSASIWPSIYTGTQPGKHGIYHSMQMEPGRQKVDRIKPAQCGQAPFWRTLDSHGKRCVIMDVPFNYPLDGFAGTQILDWGTYERNYQPHSLPGEVLTEISRRFSAYPFGEEMSRDAPSSVAHFSRARTQLLTGAELKGDVVRWLMSSQSWDFLMAVFSETHPAGHYFWSFHSNGHDGAFPELATTIKDIYSAVDAQLGKVVELLDESTTLLVLSGQGMGPNAAYWHLIPDVLAELGLLVTKTRNDRKSAMRAHWLGEARDFIPLRWRRSVSRQIPGRLRDRLRSYWATARIDWSQTRAFYLPTDLLGYVRINLKGREPQGLVEPGLEYDDICDQIISALKELTHPRTCKRIVRDVFHRKEIFAGPEGDRLPDLIVTWRDEIGEVCFPRGDGTKSGGAPDPRSGNHRPRGFALLCGPGIGKGRDSQGHIVDIAPTVLKHFGLTPPSDFDGQPWSKIISC